jgi:uncharacterized protein (UPF0332 family)
VVVRRCRAASAASVLPTPGTTSLSWYALMVVVRVASKETLLRVSKATRSIRNNWIEGVYLQSSTGRTLDELCDRATADRLALSRQFLKDGDTMMGTSPIPYRSVISRYYYAMYHTMRAVVYYQFGGDDHEQHSTLPGHTPADFPNAAIWQNALKDAREHRNAADYDPYPKTLSYWQAVAGQLSTQAHNLMPIARSYLRSKGSRFV